MNLLFYNFNDFNESQPNGRRSSAASKREGRTRLMSREGPQTQGGLRTQNNFYRKQAETPIQNSGMAPPKMPGQNQIVPIPEVSNIHEQGYNYVGDRVPTRERQFRSANQNFSRGGHRPGYDPKIMEGSSPSTYPVNGNSKTGGSSLGAQNQ